MYYKFFEATYPELHESFPRIPTVFIVSGSQYPLEGSPKQLDFYSKVPTFWPIAAPALKPTFHPMIRKMSSYNFRMRDLSEVW